MTCTSSSKAGADAGGTRLGYARVRGLRRWLARAKGLGLTIPEIVSELHVCRGLRLPEVAQVLGVSVKAVREHWRERGGEGAWRAPKTAADFAGLREQIGVALWQTVAASFAEKKGEAGEPAPTRPPMMAVRIKALKQIAKLYGAGREKRARRGASPK